MSDYEYKTEKVELKYIRPIESGEIWNIFEKHRGQRVFNVPNDLAFCVDNPDLILKSDFDQVVKERDLEAAEKEKVMRFCETITDLSGCYDAADVVNICTVRLNELKAERDVLKEHLKSAEKFYEDQSGAQYSLLESFVEVVKERDALLSDKKIYANQQLHIAKLEAKLAEAEKCIEFYAARANWELGITGFVEINDSDWSVVHEGEVCYGDDHGGKLARQTLAKFRGAK